jgi:hypothetical protein
MLSHTDDSCAVAEIRDLSEGNERRIAILNEDGQNPKDDDIVCDACQVRIVELLGIPLDKWAER